MAMTIEEVLRERRLSEKEERERAKAAAEWYILHRREGVTYEDAGIKFRVSPHRVKYQYHKLKYEARKQELEGKGE